MGIAGLLPSLKSIQKTKHLSEFKGQTVAVDAYVWLHRGVYACATELATGKPTHKYVDYAMHRVRLLRHFGIEPYIVFDGGPLPAKRGTESERKQRREENRARGKALSAQGKHSQARDCFIKCIDVTPQMAYQFIKALRAEGVQYIVAPYEADAQLAYLERTGVVSAILTEDSDLLVFGCHNVLFKLDHVANTVSHIARCDFGSVRSTASDSSIINLHGWNDTQFRAMAILSGCDYLPSIPGIGLKTANTLLRKWKTAEAVVKAVMLEGKKNVPKEYWKQFVLAEKCFRFQRVYDPLEEKLAHLTPVEGEWDEEVDAYVGELIEPELAKRIALGDADPVTHEAMKDINPGFKPRGFKSTTQAALNPPNRTDKGKGKALGGILSFFGSNPIIPREQPTTAKVNVKPNMTGVSSGKRRLGEVMDQDIASRRQPLSPHPQGVVESRFFSTSTSCKKLSPRRASGGPIASSSRKPEDNKENICIVVCSDDEPELLSDLSRKAEFSPTQDLDFDFDEVNNAVEQEDGYMSPLSSYSGETQELSSPAARVFTPLKKKKRKSPQHRNTSGSDAQEIEEDVCGRAGKGWQEDDEFDVESIPSPISTVKKRQRHSLSSYVEKVNHQLPSSRTPSRSLSMGNILVADTPARRISRCEVDDVETIPDVFGARILVDKKNLRRFTFTGPDLQSCLGGDDDDDDDGRSDEGEQGSLEKVPGVRSALGTTSTNIRQALCSGSTSPVFSPSPPTPEDGAALPVTVISHPAGRASDGDVKGKARLIIDVDTLEVEMMEMEAEIEAAQEEVEVQMEDPEEEAVKIQAQSEKFVAQGWRMKWALGQLSRDSSSSSLSSQTSMKPKTKRDDGRKKRQSMPMMSTAKLRRNETNVTPLGRHSLANAGTNKPLQRPNAGSGNTWQQQLKKRSSLVFIDDQDTPSANTKSKITTAAGLKIPKPKFLPEDDIGYSSSEDIIEISEEAWKGLGRFRYQ